MKPKRGESQHDFLQRVLIELLDTFPGVIIMAQREDGSAMIAAGGAGEGSSRASRDAESARRFDMLLAAAPELIRFWAESRGLTPAEEEVH